jgi:hypothetical protein
LFTVARLGVALGIRHSQILARHTWQMLCD